MEIEIDDHTRNIQSEEINFCEGLISVKTKERVFIFGGNKFNIHLVFKDEKDFDKLLDDLNDFKIHRGYTPKE